MAGERKGKTYEALVFLALDALLQKRRIAGRVFWNQKPDGMTIEPDFTIGADANRPTHLFLVTHSGSTKESDKKFWRNMGELAEAKTRLATLPCVYTIAFDSNIKADLKTLQEAAFDGQLIVGDLPYGPKLEAWIAGYAAGLPVDAEAKAAALRQMLADRRDGAPLRSLLDKFICDLDRLIAKNRPDLDLLWEAQRKRTKVRVPTARTTSVRRGLSKLLIFDDVSLALRLYRRARVAPSEVPDYAFALGLASRSIVGASPSDSDILNAVTILSDDAIRQIVSKAPVVAMRSWLTALRHADHLGAMSEYVGSTESDLCNPKRLKGLLAALHDDPGSIEVTPRLSDWPPSSVWLLEFLIEFVRLSTGSANGYGYAQLEQEVSKLDGMPRAGDRAYRITLPDWVHRRGNEQLSDRLLSGIAQCLAARLKALGSGRFSTLAQEVPASFSRHLIEVKLCTYRMFDPIGILIASAVGKGASVKLQNCFAEAAGLGGQAGFTSLIRAKNTVINWQSCSDAGRDHKKKELCGRAAGLRHTWSASERGFVQRPQTTRLLLVVDGTWRQDDLDALTRAGWDEIFYPDEMDKLVKAIV